MVVGNRGAQGIRIASTCLKEGGLGGLEGKRGFLPKFETSVNRKSVCVFYAKNPKIPNPPGCKRAGFLRADSD